MPQCVEIEVFRAMDCWLLYHPEKKHLWYFTLEMLTQILL